MKTPIDFEVLRKRLLKRHSELSKRHGRVSRDVRHADGLDSDFEEQAVQRENDDVLANLDEVLCAEVRQIEGALHRLEAGRYGICEKCSKPIATKRLEALPYATRCIACQ